MILVKKKQKIKREQIVGLVLACIPLLGFLLFGFIPIIMAVMMSFMDIRGIRYKLGEYIGFANYSKLFADPLFFKAVGNTFLAATAVPISLVISLGVAVLLHNNKIGTKLFRSIFFIPFVCSVVALSAMWKLIYDENFGILNSVLGKQIPWLGDSKYFMGSMIVMIVWSTIGYGIILYSAALGNVPKSLYEAAKLDGATGHKAFINITLPSISPITFFLLVTGFVSAFQDFARFMEMGGAAGGPGGSGLTVVFLMYQMGFQNFTNQGKGLASALSLVWAAVIGVFSLINFGLSKLWVHNDA